MTTQLCVTKGMAELNLKLKDEKLETLEIKKKTQDLRL